ANAYVHSFVHFQDWQDRVDRLNKYRKVTKQELVDFANTFFVDNYVVVYKKQGENTGLVKVENPGITPIELNRDKKSPLLVAFNKIETPEIEPQVVNYQEAIKKTKTKNNLDVSYIENTINDLAELNIIFDMGKDND